MRRRRRVNGGRWQVERERCQIGHRFPGDSPKDAIPLSQAVLSVVQSLGIEGQVWLRELESEWVSLAGEDIARHARPGRYDQGRLVIFVDNPVWLNELKRYGKTELELKLKTRYGKERIRSLSLQLDPGS